MTNEELLYAIPLIGLALVVVVINDRQKAKLVKKSEERGEAPNPEHTHNKTSWRYVAELLFGSILLTLIYVFGNPKWVPWLIAAIILGAILKAFWPIIWIYAKAPFGGSKPKWIVSSDNGTQAACPKCGVKIVFSSVESGTQAFDCKSCGEQGTWK